MWSNSDGDDFTLPPKHAALFRAAAAVLSDNLGWEPDQDYGEMGIAAYDRLTQGQKQAAILEVSRALLRPTVEPPRVTAALAAVVDVIYHELQGLIENEIDLDEMDHIEIDLGEHDNEPSYRSMLLDAMTEANYWEDVRGEYAPGDEPEPPPPPDCTDVPTWTEFVESLRTTILADYDFEMEDQFLDLPPAEAELLKRQLNIDADYFVAVPDDPTPSQLQTIRQEIQALLW